MSECEEGGGVEGGGGGEGRDGRRRGGKGRKEGEMEGKEEGRGWREDEGGEVVGRDGRRCIMHLTDITIYNQKLILVIIFFFFFTLQTGHNA